jgi:hypothetical protein
LLSLGWHPLGTPTDGAIGLQSFVPLVGAGIKDLQLQPEQLPITAGYDFG